MRKKINFLLCDRQQEEPDELRGSRPVPWEPWGEIPWGDPISRKAKIHNIYSKKTFNQNILYLCIMNSWDLGHIITHHINQKGDTVSHKKLQKLLYYVEAWHLVNFKKPILEENFEAWIHGPVVPEIYHKLKGFGFNNLQVVNDEFDTVDKEINEIIERNNILPEQLELIESVLNRYGSLTSFELELLSHSEAPWIEARQNIPPHVPCNNVIPKNRMLEFYSNMN